MFIIYNKKTKRNVDVKDTISEAANAAKNWNAQTLSRDYTFCTKNSFYYEIARNIRKLETI